MSLAVPAKQRQFRFVLYPIIPQGRQRVSRNLLRMRNELVRIGGPIKLDPAGKVSHGIALDSDARNSQLLALHQCRACAAEWVERAHLARDAEALQIPADQVRWKGKNEAVPVMSGPVLHS